MSAMRPYTATAGFTFDDYFTCPAMSDTNPESKKYTREDRARALQHLNGGGLLIGVSEWLAQANNFLLVAGRTAQVSTGRKNYQTLLWKQVARVRRYYFAMARLSWLQKDEQDRTLILHAIDGYFPLLESALEVGVEFDLALLFKSLFEPEDAEWDRKLGEAIANYRDFTKERHNHKFWFRGAWLDRLMAGEGRPLQLPPSVVQHREQGKAAAAEALKESQARVDESAKRPGEVHHWFPVQGPDGRFFVEPGQQATVRPRSAGSMQWRCQTVLGHYVADAGRAQFWTMAYDSQYDILNRYSHPAQGYDDNFRHDLERMADLFRVQIGALTYGWFYLLPSCLSELDISLERPRELGDRWGYLERGIMNIMKEGLPLMAIIDSADYLPVNK
jgi:hypothetical protein